MVTVGRRPWPTEPKQSDLDVHLAEQSWCAEIPQPADAIHVQPWADLDYEGRPSRMFTVSKATIDHQDGTARIAVIGIQSEACQRSILAEGVPSEMSAGQSEGYHRRPTGCGKPHRNLGPDSANVLKINRHTLRP